MTTESNNNKNPLDGFRKKASDHGFWGKPSVPMPEPEPDFTYDYEPDSDYEPEFDTDYEYEPEPAEAVVTEHDAEPQADSPTESLPKLDEPGEVPPWLKLSHTMDSTLPASAERNEVAADHVAPVASLADRVVVLPPQEDSASADAEGVVPSEERPSVRESVLDLAWDDLDDLDDNLSWSDDVEGQADFADVDSDEGSILTEPEQMYIDADLGYSGEPSVFDGGDTDRLVNLTAYDEGEPISTSVNRNRLRIIALVVAVVIALGIVYALGVRRFTNHLLPNTRINGFDASGMTVDEARAALEAETAEYACDVSVKKFDVTVNGSDISIDRDEQSMADQAMNGQNAYAWPVALLFGNSVSTEPSITFDENNLRSIVTTAVEDYNQKNLPTDEAVINYNEETGLFEAAGTTKGTAVDAQAVCDATIEDVRAFNRTSTPSAKTATHEATVHDIPSYEKTAQNANRSRTSDVPILVNGETVIVSDAAQNAEWVKVGDGPSVVVDEDGVRTWAEYYVADAVYHSDDWSNYYLNTDAFVSEFCERLSNGVVDGYEAPTIDELRTEGESREKAYAKGGWNSELGRYIDVDLESQFARLFDETGNVIWESAFVSGEVYAGRSTVEGLFEIYSMETNTVLVGMDYDNDGKPDYESFVNYWMPFYGGYGLHDATWRSNFGGDYYYYYGSHGCVNLPYSKAEELFNITFVGEKVNVHW